MAVRSENFLLRRYIEKAMVDLPALPTTVLRVVKAIEEGEASANQLEKIITADAAITTKVLKTVNSPYFGLSRQVTSVNQAVSILGMNQLRNVTLSIGVLNALNTNSPRIKDLQKECWERSFASALCAQKLARATNQSHAVTETVLIGGLLHDIGQLFLLTLFNIPYAEVQSRSLRMNQPLAMVEQQVLGTSHAELGASLAERWAFPVELVEMIRDHEGNVEGEVKPAVGCVHIADRFVKPAVGCVHIADRFVNFWREEGEVHERFPISPQVREWLGWTDEQLAEFFDSVTQEIESAQATFDVA